MSLPRKSRRVKFEFDEKSLMKIDEVIKSGRFPLESLKGIEMTKPKSTWGGKRKGAGPKSRKEVLRELAITLSADLAEEIAMDLEKSNNYGKSLKAYALRNYAKRIREAQAK